MKSIPRDVLFRALDYIEQHPDNWDQAIMGKSFLAIVCVMAGQQRFTTREHTPFFKATSRWPAEDAVAMARRILSALTEHHYAALANPQASFEELRYFVNEATEYLG